MLTDIASPTTPCDQPNSWCSGVIITPGTERNPAAPRMATKLTAATTQAQWMPADGRAFVCGGERHQITVSDESGLRIVARMTTVIKNMPIWVHASCRRPAAAARGRLRRGDRADAVLQRHRRRRRRALRGGHLRTDRWPGRGHIGVRHRAQRGSRRACHRRHRGDPRHAVSARPHRRRAAEGGRRPRWH